MNDNREVVMLRMQNVLDLNCVYRVFDNEEHANDFVRGKIFVSTFGRCRAYEDSHRGDAREGWIRHTIPKIKEGDASDPAFRNMAASLGISLSDDCSGIKISGSKTLVLPDAFILCATLQPPEGACLEEFGKYWVKINDPADFFYLLTKYLKEKYKVGVPCFGKVAYMTREYQNENIPPPIPVAFIKPLAYSHQKEVRVVWDVEAVTQNALQPTLLDCSEAEIKKFCERIA